MVEDAIGALNGTPVKKIRKSNLNSKQCSKEMTKTNQQAVFYYGKHSLVEPVKNITNSIIARGRIPGRGRTVKISLNRR